VKHTRSLSLKRETLTELSADVLSAVNAAAAQQAITSPIDVCLSDRSPVVCQLTYQPRCF
jgi:hypothetical protein